MFFLVMLFFFGLLMIFFFYLLNFFLDYKKFYLSKVNVFESGFLNVKKIQSSFSVQFFVIMLIFVIFDLEIVMFLGFLISDWSSLFSFFFICFCYVGFLYSVMFW
uniref:NADH-ubiquinone oxidoreductase chain 3 n=1 Tax=Dictyocaulus eckerti TaxID=44604 RepID=K7QM23_DICEC|nr:NADH dehydrogenase subunit 3 [Dictyocaulus eckerti]AFV32093.1 NADH dehydrogenase subunit 3 [Dictyocaulus eckerti]